MKHSQGTAVEMTISYSDLVTLAFHSFSTLLLVGILTFCTTKKGNKSSGPSGASQPPAATSPIPSPSASQAEGKKEAPAAPAPAPDAAVKEKKEVKKEEDDDDEEDFKFKINVKKPEEPKDVFDDEANPAAGITVRKNKKGQPKNTPNKSVIGKAASGTKQQQNSGQKKSKKGTIQEAERPFLAPNEKQIGVSCYQFDGNLPPPPPPSVPAPPAAPAALPSTIAPVAPASPNELNKKTVVPNPLKTEIKSVDNNGNDSKKKKLVEPVLAEPKEHKEPSGKKKAAPIESKSNEQEPPNENNEKKDNKEAKKESEAKNQ